jgi:methylthioribulose-1-phosphate dehydratase
MNDPRPTLIESARQFYQLGWMVGTAGNLSGRISNNSFWITASGKSKGKLQETDFLLMSIDEGKIIDSKDKENKPSAETSIHQVIYRLFPEAQACYHVHSVEANLVSNQAKGDKLDLPSLEMLKGLGVWEENPKVTMPVFENYLSVPKIAEEISDRFSQSPPAIPALLIRNHGVTVWGNSTEATQNHLEIAEYIFRYLVTGNVLA